MAERTRDEVFKDLFGGDIAYWQKDEDGDMTVVLHSWEAFKAIGNTIIDELGDLLIAAECWKPADRCGAKLKMQARTDNLVKIGKKLAKMFGVAQKRFTKKELLDKVFTTDAEDWVFCEAIEVEDLIGRVANLEIGFADTYDCCCKCCSLIYTQPTSYSDYGRYRQTDDGIICLDCDKKDPEGYLAEYLEDIEAGKLRGFNIPIPKDFVEISEVDTFMGEPRRSPIRFESGLHIGQRDNPKKQYKALKGIGVDAVIFDVSTGQFDVSWTVYVRKDDYDKALKLLTTIDLTDERGPGDYAKAALEGISKQGIAAAQPGCVSMTSINTSTGAVTTRQVSAQDFIDGKALING